MTMIRPPLMYALILTTLITCFLKVKLGIYVVFFPYKSYNLIKKEMLIHVLIFLLRLNNSGQYRFYNNKRNPSPASFSPFIEKE